MMPGKEHGAGLALVCAAVYIAFLSFSVSGSSTNAGNSAKELSPVVKITTPQNASIHDWNSLVDYNIVVTDHGKSTKYQEIPSSQVLLKTTYVPDVSKTVTISDEEKKPDPAGLRNIMNSNCLGCHSFKSKAMGPSFAAISKRYPHTQAKVDALSQSIRNGSTGVWGQAAMPPHPGLTEAELHAVSFWILNDADDPDVNYYVGTEGAFQMDSPGRPGPNGGLILTASYTSHAAENDPHHHLRGEDTIIVHGK